MPIEITTNNHIRETVDGWNVPADIRADFDYVDWQAVDNGEDSAEFVVYRGDWYDLGDVMLAPDSLRALGWDGFNPDSHWSGIAFRYFGTDGELINGGGYVIVGSVYISD